MLCGIMVRALFTILSLAMLLRATGEVETCRAKDNNNDNNNKNNNNKNNNDNNKDALCRDTASDQSQHLLQVETTKVRASSLNSNNDNDNNSKRKATNVPRFKDGSTAAICMVARFEDIYIDEWADYQFSLGF
ncbi:unnamed protein product, partial [Polarella glacialis]